MRIRTFTAAIALSAAAAIAPAIAGPPPPPAPPEVLQRIYACIDVADGPARLACYDGAVGALKTAQVQGEFAAVDAVGVRKLEREAFGFSMPSLPRLGLPGFAKTVVGGKSADILPTNEVDMTIDRVGRLDGQEAFMMSNGQTWTHIDSQTNRNARAGAKVTVRRAALGSYLMHVEKGGAALRVRRTE